MIKEVDLSKFKARCSAIGKIMSNSTESAPLTDIQKARMSELEAKESPTEKQKQELATLLLKNENSLKFVPSVTCMEYMMEAYAWETEQMIPVDKESMDVLQMKKGKLGEATAVKLLSLVDGTEYFTHKERVSNDFLTGEIDIYSGIDVWKAISVADIKNSFDYPSFLKKINTSVDLNWRLQVQGYGDILEPENLLIAHCLVDTPDEVKEQVKWRLASKMNALTIESPEFLKEWAKFDHSMSFDKTIPVHKRVYKQKVERWEPSYQQKVYDRVKNMRDWLCNFHEWYQQINL